MIIAFPSERKIGEVIRDGSSSLDPKSSADHRQNPMMIIRRASKEEHFSFWKSWAEEHGHDFSSYEYPPVRFFYEVSTD